MTTNVLSKQKFDALMKTNGITNSNVELQDAFFVSIIGTNPGEEQSFFKEPTPSNVLIQHFDDVINDVEIPIIGTGKSEPHRAFTEEDARVILEFIVKNKDKKQCFIHCAAGIARSGAVGTFVNDFFGGNWFEFKRKNPYVQPNNLVLSLLRKIYRESYD